MKDAQTDAYLRGRLAIDGAGLFAVLFGCLFGIFAAMGLCAAIWDGTVLDTVLGGAQPHRSHPAHWIFPLFMIPFMLVGFAGTTFALYFPICFHWPAVVASPRTSLGRPMLGWLLRYSIALTAYCRRELARL